MAFSPVQRDQQREAILSSWNYTRECIFLQTMSRIWGNRKHANCLLQTLGPHQRLHSRLYLNFESDIEHFKDAATAKEATFLLMNCCQCTFSSATISFRWLFSFLFFFFFLLFQPHPTPLKWHPLITLGLWENCLLSIKSWLTPTFGEWDKDVALTAL